MAAIKVLTVHLSDVLAVSVKTASSVVSFPDPSHGEEGSGNIAIPKLFLRNAISA